MAVIQYFQGELADKNIGDFTSQIDFEETSLKQRVVNLNSILNTQRYKDGGLAVDPFFEEYYNTHNSKSFNVHPNTSQPNGTDDFIGRQLEFMANYLLYSKENLEYNDCCSHPIETDNSQFKKKKKNSSYEGAKERNEGQFERDLAQEKVKQYDVQTMYKLDKRDMNVKQIKDLQDAIMIMRGKLQQSQTKCDNGALIDGDIKILMSTDKKRIKSLMKGMKQNQIDISKMLRRPIQFNNVPSGRSCYTFWDNTGYYNENDEYVEISRNKIELSNYKHIYHLLRFYGGMKEIVSDDLKSDWRYLLWELEYLIDNTPLNDSERDILIWKIDGCDSAKIINNIKEKYKIDMNQPRLSEMFTNIIPKKIVEKYLDERLDYIYTYKAKGIYKKCSKCKEVKLAINRYFGKESKGVYGLKSRCKSCQ